MTNRDAGINAMGDPMRRAIMERLACGALAVGELADQFPVSRPAVSQHLRVLKDAGLVNDERAGNRRLYRANPEGVAALRTYFDRLWTQALSAYGQTVENSEAEHVNEKEESR